MKIQTTIILSLVALAGLVTLSSTSAMSLLSDTEVELRRLMDRLPPANNQTSSQMSLAQAVAASLFDSSQAHLRVVILDAADKTLTENPKAAPTLAILITSNVGALAIGILLSHKISKPFQKLLLATKAVARGKYDGTEFSKFATGRTKSRNSKNKNVNFDELEKDELSQLFAT